MSKKILRVKLKIEVSREGEEILYFSSIQDFKEEYFSISLPYRRGRPLNLRMGDRVKITVPGDSEAFSFVSEVIGQRNDPLRLIDLALPERIERIQRRHFVRLPVNIDVFFAEGEDAEENLTYFKAATVDLSEGGMRIRTSQNFPLETCLWVKFTLPLEGNPVEIFTRTRVVRTVVQFLDSGKFYETALEFIDLPGLRRDQIFTYVFKRMIEQRQLV
jgi:c-di-GMP-binding flagellar brake protein YcgR